MAERATSKLLVVASEVVGFAKTGGLADVAGALPRALARRGHECAIVVPLYRSARNGPIAISPTPHSFSVHVGDKTVPARLWRATLPNSNVAVHLIEQPNYFERDDPSAGRGLYQFALPDGQKRDYADNCARFVFFCRAALEAMTLLDYWPDVIHANDWQTGLIPVYLKEERRARPEYDEIGSLFTIHNIAYQGLFWHWDMPLTGLPWHLFNPRQLEFYGHMNLLKAGMIYSDWLTTVSPTYAREIQTPEYGCGLDGVLRERRDRLVGIVNGVDYGEWSPATDAQIAARYDAESVAQGKTLCKRALQQRFNLPLNPRTPLLGMVSRLVEQKGLSLVDAVAPLLLAESDVQWAFLGEGEPKYHEMLRQLKIRFPNQVGLMLGFDDALAHQIEAGADVFVMPSQFEPSGLNQLYSLKYGTVPVVRATGGLTDTVTDCTPEKMANRTATGFRFVPYVPAALLSALRRALECYARRPDEWARLMQTGMRQDWSWDRSAADYERVITSIRNRRRPAVASLT
jgi:starch synthase